LSVQAESPADLRLPQDGLSGGPARSTERSGRKFLTPGAAASRRGKRGVKSADAPHPVHAASNDVDDGPDWGVYSQMAKARQGHGGAKRRFPGSQRLIYRVPRSCGEARMT
jgi:hypothetical protein